MSEENVEVVRRTYAEWERGNMKAGVEVFDPEIVYESYMPDSTERVVVNTPEEVKGFMREWLAQWRDLRLFVDECREIGSDKVFVGGHQTATGRLSGIVVEDTVYSVWTFRGGKIVHLLFERERQRALEAAGLRE
jgi:ketosteroid isomerase-like protein